MSEDYDTFLASKRRKVADVGVTVSPTAIHPSLFGFQREIVQWALRKGRAAIFADTGLGKSRMQVEWARLIADRSLILAPLSVARQTVAESQKIGVEVTYVRHPREIDRAHGVWITNYEMADRFDPAVFGAVVLDECFAAGTLVDTPQGSKQIEDFRIGDLVNCASGPAEVWDVHRREVPYAIEVKLGNERVVCSPNHPWFTQRGWVGAQDLEPSDSLVSTAEAMRMVRGELCEDKEADARDISFLRHVLLSEVEDERPGTESQGAQSRGRRKAGRIETSMVGVGDAEGSGRIGSGAAAQSPERSESTGQGLPPIEGDAPRTFRAWGKWEGHDGTTGSIAGCAWAGVGAGVVHITGPTDTRISNALQARLGERRSASRYRSGWQLPLLPPSPGCEEGREVAFARVGGIEVLEPGHPRLDQFRDADGKLYFYDLGVAGHPSYSIAGRLVHNSSILKNVTGRTRVDLTRQWAHTPYRLACTATPAPNDVAELCNHAEFLGILPRAEMLSAYFVHDDEGWRLKGHAAESMYEWMATWSVALRRPSDIGHPEEDGLYDLPPLNIYGHEADVTIQPEGQLFATDLGGVSGRHQVRRHTLDARVELAEELSSKPGQWIVWCGLNDEAKAIAHATDGAVNLEGSWDPERKADTIEAFQDGAIRVLVTKPSIAGFGMNFQNCHQMIFLGMNDSYETYYQAIRRCYRFGQRYPVDVHIVVSALESQIVENVRRKELSAYQSASALIRHQEIRT